MDVMERDMRERELEAYERRTNTEREKIELAEKFLQELKRLTGVIRSKPLS